MTKNYYVNKKYKDSKKYQCPFCSNRYNRNDMSNHILDVHDGLLQPNDDVSQIIYDQINKPKKQCVICKSETKWNPIKCKYDRLCTNPECKRKYKELVDKRTYNIYNKTPTDMLNDPEFQIKMLHNKSISGTYKFTTGGTVNYTGTYEKEFLKFLDEVMKFKSEDVIGPGPVIDYVFNGKNLKWITDFYLPQYNLVVEIKDGGNNPNTRTMEEYRNKQIAKEESITKLGRYNYIRLTNKEHEQFFEILSVIKNSLIEETDNLIEFRPIIMINENTNEIINIYNPDLSVFM